MLTKREVRTHTGQMTWSAVPGGLQPAVSGGTSGDTLHFYVDHVRQAQSMGARLFMQDSDGDMNGVIPAFLDAGLNVISAANGTLSIDYYVRDGGDGMCTLP